MHGSLQRLIVPVDGSAGDRRVLELVGEWMHQQAVSITLLYVVEVVQSMPLDAELPAEVMRGETALARAEALAHASAGKATTITSELLQSRSTGAAVVDEAIERDADAIVIAAANRRKHGQTTLGETIAYVLKNAPCEVMLIRLAPSERASREAAWP